MRKKEGKVEEIEEEGRERREENTEQAIVVKLNERKRRKTKASEPNLESISRCQRLQQRVGWKLRTIKQQHIHHEMLRKMEQGI